MTEGSNPDTDEERLAARARDLLRGDLVFAYVTPGEAAGLIERALLLTDEVAFPERQWRSETGATYRLLEGVGRMSPEAETAARAGVYRAIDRLQSPYLIALAVTHLHQHHPLWPLPPRWRRASGIHEAMLRTQPLPPTTEYRERIENLSNAVRQRVDDQLSPAVRTALGLPPSPIADAGSAGPEDLAVAAAATTVDLALQREDANRRTLETAVQAATTRDEVARLVDWAIHSTAQSDSPSRHMEGRALNLLWNEVATVPGSMPDDLKLDTLRTIAHVAWRDEIAVKVNADGWAEIDRIAGLEPSGSALRWQLRSLPKWDGEWRQTDSTHWGGFPRAPWGRTDPYAQDSRDNLKELAHLLGFVEEVVAGTTGRLRRNLRLADPEDGGSPGIRAHAGVQTDAPTVASHLRARVAIMTERLRQAARADTHGYRARRNAGHRGHGCVAHRHAGRAEPAATTRAGEGIPEPCAQCLPAVGHIRGCRGGVPDGSNLGPPERRPCAA